MVRDANRSLNNCSPHPRGWSHAGAGLGARHPLLPAPAGMVPQRRRRRCGRGPAPRTRGDGPWERGASEPTPPCSPHPRGWSLAEQQRGAAVVLLPAPAGMVPSATSRAPCPLAAPRTRGDGPRGLLRPSSLRGCSPHPRGWSRRHGPGVREGLLLPAPAGMVLPAGPRNPDLPAAPRTRGDGPTMTAEHDHWKACSPHPRGWSRAGVAVPRRHRLLPAPAGMVPSSTTRPPRSTSAPRTRGDGPSPTPKKSTKRACSPHPRGWSRLSGPVGVVAQLLPAPAGMVPEAPRAGAAPGAAPRTRGDGPVMPVP